MLRTESKQAEYLFSSSFGKGWTLFLWILDALQASRVKVWRTACTGIAERSAWIFCPELERVRHLMGTQLEFLMTPAMGLAKST